MVSAEGVVPNPPAAAFEAFGAELPTLVRYAGWLAEAGVQRGLLGPRESARLWDRHILNCAAVGELISPGARLCDLGSGAGLPGVVLAVVRPDVTVTLLEPSLRRTTFLSECVRDLGLTNVSVLRGRAEDWAGRMDMDVVTARAVAPLSRLAEWALPLLRPGGELLALKGDGADAEIAEADQLLTDLGAESRNVVRVGSPALAPPSTVIRVRTATHPVRSNPLRSTPARSNPARSTAARRSSRRGR